MGRVGIRTDTRAREDPQAQSRCPHQRREWDRRWAVNHRQMKTALLRRKGTQTEGAWYSEAQVQLITTRWAAKWNWASRNRLRGGWIVTVCSGYILRSLCDPWISKCPQGK